MAYNGLTNLGIEYLARMISEEKPITFTKIKVGNGSIPQGKTGETTVDLYSFKKEVEILSKKQTENAIELQLLIENLDLEEGFYIKELGVYVQDGEEEKLYWYINKDNPSFLPNKNTPSKHRYKLYLEVSNLESIIINFTGQDLLVDKKFVEESISEAFNNFESGYNKTIEGINNELNKIASNEEAGRIKVGEGLEIDGDGVLSVEETTERRPVSDTEKEKWNNKFDRGIVPTALNNAEKIIKALQGNGGINFDENLLYLNDAGTKKKGYCYLDKLTNGIFECIEENTTTVNDASKFRNISNKENSDRLENLTKLEEKFYNNNDLANPGITFSINDNNKFIYIVVNSFLSCDLGRKTYDQHYIFSIEVLKKTKTLYQHIYGYGNSSTTSLESMRITIENNTISISWASGTTNDNSVKYVGMI